MKDSQTADVHSKPTSQTLHQQTQYAGGKPPSHIEKVFVRPAAPQIEDLKRHRASLKKVASQKEVLGGSSMGNANRDMAITSPGDGIADTSTPDPSVDTSLGVLPLTLKSPSPRVLKEPIPLLHTNPVDNFMRFEPGSHSDQPSSEVPTPVDVGRLLSIYSSNIKEYLESKPHLHPSSPPALSPIGPKTARESHSSSTYSNNPTSGENLSVYDNASIHNYEDTSVILRQSSNAGDPRAVRYQTRTVPDIQVVPPSSPEPSQRPAKLGHEGLDELELLRSRLRSAEIFDDRDHNSSIGRRQFDSVPHLVSKSYPHQPDERVLPLQSEIVEDPEVLGMQQKYSRVLLFMCCLFPPLLYILAYGAMDHMMLSFTDGRVAHVGVFYKRVAFFVGTVVGTTCCCIPIVFGILAAKGAL